MPIPGVEFKIRRPAIAAATTRADVAAFAGLIGRRSRPLPSLVRSALADAGWREGGSFPVSDARLNALLGVPVAVESWTEFDALFDWRSRAPVVDAADQLPCPLGLAVRQFFLQGGVRAWIIRCGDPLPLAAPTPDDEPAFRERQLAALAGSKVGLIDAQPILPGFEDRSPAADPLDAATWQGAALIYAIADAAMLLLPDLPELAAGPAKYMEAPEQPPGPPEEFRPCAPAFADETPEPRNARPLYRAPRLGQDGYRLWSSALRHALQLLGRPRGPEHRRDVMVVSSLPIPESDGKMPPGSEQWPLAVLSEKGNAGTKKAPLALFDADAIGNPRLQLGYPWMATPDAAMCPEGLQSPEGTLAGMIARTALEQGAFRSAAGKKLTSSALLAPRISGSDVARGLPGRADWLGDRLCIFRERRGQIELMSDSTAAEDRAWRKGGVSRLIGTLLRACRHIGDEYIFESAGPAVWSQLAARVTDVLDQLRALGAFEGLSASECYRVTCDRNTMTDADIDAGRVRCEVIVNPASPIERIVVTLALLEPAPSMTREAA
jgi:Bacteriophage tail sheath protein